MKKKKVRQFAQDIKTIVDAIHVSFRDIDMHLKDIDSIVSIASDRVDKFLNDIGTGDSSESYKSEPETTIFYVIPNVQQLRVKVKGVLIENVILYENQADGSVVAIEVDETGKNAKILRFNDVKEADDALLSGDWRPQGVDKGD